MKRNYYLLAIVLVVLLSTFSMNANAQYTLTLADVTFNKSTGTITDYSNTTEKDIIIPEKLDGVDVKIVGGATFYNDQLTSVVIPNTVSVIGDAAFSRNPLTSIVIPNSVDSIGNSAFYMNQLASVVIPNSVNFIGESAFENNLLTSVILSNSLNSIESYAFSTNRLASVTIPNSVKTIGEFAFATNKLTSVILSDSVNSIGKASFQNNKLVSLTIPNSVKIISEYAFNDNQLTSVTLSNFLETIERRTFSKNKLTSVIIPNSVSSIGVSAFDFNDNLSSIILPKDVIGYENEIWKDSFNKDVSEMEDFALTYAVRGDKISYYTITFVDFDDAEIEKVLTDKTNAATAPTDPTRIGYDFTGWDIAFDNITSDLTVKAEYSIKTYAVTFVDFDDKEISKETVNHGNAAIAPTDPTRTNYNFTGWSVAFDDVTSDLTVKAEYSLNTSIETNSATIVRTYPNPATTSIFVEGSKGIVLIYNLTGSVLIRHDLVKGNQINVSQLPAGTYILNIGKKNTKIIKE